MPLKVNELFGFAPDSAGIRNAVDSRLCPFLKLPCWKRFKSGLSGGLCSASQTKNPEIVICCPWRLYAEDYQILRRVSNDAFGAEVPFLTGSWTLPSIGNSVIPFGQRMGKELKVEARGTKYAFDWILALVSPNGVLQEFVAVEVQSIDTTGNYQLQSWDIQASHGSKHIEAFTKPAKAKSSNFNFENVNKRILPQIITKGHLLRLESLCKKGLFFVCPTPVMNRIERRLGGALKQLPMQNGSVTFHDYTLDTESGIEPYPLRFNRSLTTTIEAVHTAFTGSTNLPDMDSYTAFIQKAVYERIQGTSLL